MTGTNVNNNAASVVVLVKATEAVTMESTEKQANIIKFVLTDVQRALA